MIGALFGVLFAATAATIAAPLRLPAWKIALDHACAEVGRVQTLPERWWFRIDPDEVGVKQGWQQTTDFSNWRTISTHRHWTFQDEPHRGVAWYGTVFDLPDVGDRPLALYFGAIFIDGVKVAEQKLGAWAMWRQAFFRPLRRDLASGPHTLVVRVEKDSFNAGTWMPVHVIDMAEPLPPRLRDMARRFLEVGRASRLREISEGGGPIEQSYYPKIQFFLKHGRGSR